MHVNLLSIVSFTLSVFAAESVAASAHSDARGERISVGSSAMMRREARTEARARDSGGAREQPISPHDHHAHGAKEQDTLDSSSVKAESAPAHKEQDILDSSGVKAESAPAHQESIAAHDTHSDKGDSKEELAHQTQDDDASTNDQKASETAHVADKSEDHQLKDDNSKHGDESPAKTDSAIHEEKEAAAPAASPATPPVATDLAAVQESSEAVQKTSGKDINEAEVVAADYAELGLTESEIDPDKTYKKHKHEAFQMKVAGASGRQFCLSELHDGYQVRAIGCRNRHSQQWFWDGKRLKNLESDQRCLGYGIHHDKHQLDMYECEEDSEYLEWMIDEEGRLRNAENGRCIAFEERAHHLNAITEPCGAPPKAKDEDEDNSVAEAVPAATDALQSAAKA